MKKFLISWTITIKTLKENYLLSLRYCLELNELNNG